MITEFSFLDELFTLNVHMLIVYDTFCSFSLRQHTFWHKNRLIEDEEF